MSGAKKNTDVGMDKNYSFCAKFQSFTKFLEIAQTLCIRKERVIEFKREEVLESVTQFFYEWTAWNYELWKYNYRAHELKNFQPWNYEIWNYKVWHFFFELRSFELWNYELRNCCMNNGTITYGTRNCGIWTMELCIIEPDCSATIFYIWKVYYYLLILQFIRVKCRIME